MTRWARQRALPAPSTLRAGLNEAQRPKRETTAVPYHGSDVDPIFLSFLALGEGLAHRSSNAPQNNAKTPMFSFV
jgi:hypothetical protein